MRSKNTARAASTQRMSRCSSQQATRENDISGLKWRKNTRRSRGEDSERKYRGWRITREQLRNNYVSLEEQPRFTAATSEACIDLPGLMANTREVVNMPKMSVAMPESGWQITMKRGDKKRL
ncbi:hypothetical protein Bbelb_240410 [Branchiostoma belcheri]|nr:hypothetical protein Bbelb_240410 [Branchiostoma belcheri]